MTTMRAATWRSINQVGLSPWKFMRPALKQLRLLNLVQRAFNGFLRARDFFGLERIVPVTHQDRLCAQLRRVIGQEINKSPLHDALASNKEVVFPHMRGSSFLELVEVFVAHRLRHQGYRPLFLICGGLPICNNYMFGEDSSNFPYICEKCLYRQKQLLRAGDVSYRVLEFTERDFVRALDRARHLTVEECYDFNYRDIPIGRLIVPSVARHIRKSAFNATEPREIHVWRQYVASAFLLVDGYSDLFLEVKPPVAMMPGGWFFWHAVADAMLRMRGVDIVFYEQAFHYLPQGKSWTFSLNKPLNDPEWITKGWEEWKNSPLTDDENARLDRTLAARRRGSIYYPSPVEAEQDIRRETKLPDDGRPVVVLFTNVTWDVTWDVLIRGRKGMAFDDMTEWIMDSIRFMANRDAWLIVRIHPAEAICAEGVYSREFLTKLLDDRLGALPVNVRIIPPVSRISAYALLDMADAIVVFGSTIGLEAAIVGKKPVIFACSSIISQKGFGQFPESRDLYFQLLGKPKQIAPPTQAEVETARRFAYLYFFRVSWPLQFFESGGNGLYSIDSLVVRSLEELRPGKNVYLDYFVARLEGRGSFVLPRRLTPMID